MQPKSALLLGVRKGRKLRKLQLAAAVICVLVVCGFSNSAASQVNKKPAVETELTIARVLENVRKAIGYDKLSALKTGFRLEEGEAAKESPVRILWLGSHGEFRQDSKPSDGRPLGFDGKFGWQIDRTGLPAPMPQRLREKLLIPAWVRSGWWLNNAAPLVFSFLPEETNQQQVALSMKLKDGLVGSKIYIARATWLPESLIVEYERGPYTLVLKDYEQALGFRLPNRTAVNYRGSDSESIVQAVAKISEGDSFTVPPLPSDTTFDNSGPAEIKTAQGVPFSSASPGHYYVRPLIDGKDVGWFHFDTGSDAMHIDAKIADELGLPILGKSQSRGADGRVQEVTIRQGKTFQLGRVTFRNPIYLAMDLSDRNAPPGEKRAGLVGYPLFARVVVAVTGGGKNIAVYEPATYQLTRGKWSELAYIDLTPAVTCRFEDGREGLFQLDTGYVGTVTFYDKYIKDERLLGGREVREETSVGAGGSYKVLTGSIKWFELAGRKFNNPQVEFRVSGLSREGGAGVVGREFLSVFTIVFDYPKRRIAFIR